MELSELQLGDVVEFSSKGNFPGSGTGTIIGLDPKDPRNPVMLGWNEGEATVRTGRDSYVVPGATYLPGATKFSNSLWMALSAIVRKVKASVPTSAVKVEQPCKQCRKMNDSGVGSCWWCGCSNPTT